MAAFSTHDVLIIGSGPAGCSVATMLARAGRRVLLVEREKFPRYHIGESLIPFTFHPLEKLGMIPKMRASCFVKKYSVSFVTADGRNSEPFYFFNRYDKGTVAQTWQVLRSEFDSMLQTHAQEHGAEVLEGVRVEELLHGQGGEVIGVRGTHPDGSRREHYARMVVDCTGKEAFSTVRKGWRVRDPFLNKVAVWTYYRGVRRATGIDEGETVVAYIPEKGWFWWIPQHDDMLSVGVVAEGKYLSRDGVRDPGEMFRREVEENVWVKEGLAVGEQVGAYFITSEYTQHARHCGGPGLLLAGDSFAFLDPVFSSGVMLALKSGVLLGEELNKAFDADDLSMGRFIGYAREVRAGVENMRKLVYAFYHQDFSFATLIRNHPDASGAITDCLSGDVNKDFSVLWDQVRELVPLPEDLDLGEPLVAW